MKLGASDGINVQILPGSNITKDTEVKVWNPSDKDKKEELKRKKQIKNNKLHYTLLNCESRRNFFFVRDSFRSKLLQV